ncbi:MAG: nucleotidyl transferase AbiEii/AbiGii toxin family protein [Elusimicrobia bacterium]|nr:nucleotidyl transferase AbiEii/AbiGii toxin family protein [Elusimicrobiota bacterium]
MFIKTVTKETRKNLAILGKSKFIQNFYLVGGTGLALQLGHRISLDLDFFTSKEFRTQDLKNKISLLGNFSITQEEENTLSGIFGGTRISFFYYRYPLLFPCKKFLNIKLAHILDIACMKIDTISSRGGKKDFIDMYFTCKKGYKLRDILNFFKEKYKDIKYNELHILKSLDYFTDADNDPTPKMLKDTNWTKIKLFFTNETRKIAKL